MFWYKIKFFGSGSEKWFICDCTDELIEALQYTYNAELNLDYMIMDNL